MTARHLRGGAKRGTFYSRKDERGEDRQSAFQESQADLFYGRVDKRVYLQLIGRLSTCYSAKLWRETLRRYSWRRLI